MGLALTAAELTFEHTVAPARPPRTPELDAATLEACQQGERRALEQFVLHHQDLVFAFLSRMLGGGPDVEDLAQEVFIRAYRALPRFELRSNVRVSTWLLKIAVRLVQDRRKRRRPVLVPLHDHLVADGSSHPERACRSREIVEAFERAASQLPDEQRMVFVLAQFHGLSMAQIAELSDVPENTVKTRLFRARERLRRLLSAIREAP
jgi:RNA polymerase sigma-70 factor (ECF subfamily)